MAKKTKNINKEAQAMVIQAYWNRDRELKRAITARDNLHDLAVLAVPLGATAGPATDDEGMPHWLTHGEKERVEMDVRALYTSFGMCLTDIFNLVSVNVAALKHAYPGIYAKALKHKSTKRTTHACLTWSEKSPLRGAKTKPYRKVTRGKSR